MDPSARVEKLSRDGIHSLGPCGLFTRHSLIKGNRIPQLNFFIECYYLRVSVFPISGSEGHLVQYNMKRLRYNVCFSRYVSMNESCRHHICYWGNIPDFDLSDDFFGSTCVFVLMSKSSISVEFSIGEWVFWYVMSLTFDSVVRIVLY